MLQPAWKDPGGGRPAAPDLHDPATRARLSPGGFRTFLAVADAFGLDVVQRRRLLGDPAESTYHRWRSQGAERLSADQLERISLVLGIHRALRTVFAEEEAAGRWLRAANADMPFSGDSPLDAMLRGSIDDLYAVRRYLDAWALGWP